MRFNTHSTTQSQPTHVLSCITVSLLVTDARAQKKCEVEAVFSSPER